MSKKEEQKEELPVEAGLSAEDASSSTEDAEIEAAAVNNADPDAEDIARQIKNLQFVVHFSKPYTFEGEEYKELDLSPIQDLTTLDLIYIDKVYAGLHKSAPLVRYTDAQYVELIAKRALNKPIEFFHQMKAKDFSEIMGVISAYFLFW